MRSFVLLVAASLGVLALAPAAQGRPLNVKVTPAQGAPAGVTVTAAGATLRARTPNGTRFTLVVPAGALDEGQQITMAPVAALRGLPFRRGAGGAVQLGPDGLRLRKAAQLTIAPKRAIPLRRQAPFAFRAGGRDLHLQAPTMSRTRVVVPILHFSGYGLGDATAAQRRSIAARDPADPEARAEADLGEAVQDARNARDGFNDPAVRDRIARALVPLYRQVLARLQAAAGGGDWRGPVGAAINLDRQLALLGYSREFLSFEPPATRDASVAATLRTLQRQIQPLVLQVLANAYARSKQQCADTRKREHAIEMLEIGRTETVLNHPHSVSTILQDARPCLRRGFKFSLSITIVYDADSTSTHTYTGKACGVDALAAEWTLDHDVSGFHTTAKTTFPAGGVLPEVTTSDPTSGNGVYRWGTRFTLVPGASGEPGSVRLDLNPTQNQPEWAGSASAPLEENDDCPPPQLPAWVAAG